MDEVVRLELWPTLSRYRAQGGELRATLALAKAAVLVADEVEFRWAARPPSLQAEAPDPIMRASDARRRLTGEDEDPSEPGRRELIEEWQRLMASRAITPMPTNRYPPGGEDAITRLLLGGSSDPSSVAPSTLRAVEDLLASARKFRMERFVWVHGLGRDPRAFFASGTDGDGLPVGMPTTRTGSSAPGQPSAPGTPSRRRLFVSTLLRCLDWRTCRGEDKGAGTVGTRSHRCTNVCTRCLSRPRRSTR